MRFNGAVLGAAVGLVGNRGGGSSRGGGGGPRECSAFSVMPSAPTGTPRGHTATRVVASAGFRFRPSRRSATTTTRISTRALSLSSSSQKRCRAYPSRPSKDSTDPGQSRRRRRGLIGVWPLFHGPHGHDDHTHGPELELELPAGGLVDLQVVGAGGATQTVRAVEAAESSTASHGGHSHGGGAHGHSHAHFHLDVSSLKTRPTLIRLFLATMCVLALPLWRRSSRLEWAALGGVSLFLAAVDMGKFAIRKLRVQVGALYTGWKAHAELASTTGLDSKSKESAREVDAITWIGAFVNVSLAGFKFFAGIIGHSSAMIADAGHSLSDLLSDAVTLWAVRLSRLPPDDDHPYGHGRFEAIGAVIISAMLMGAGYGIGNHSFEALRELASGGVHTTIPTRLAAVAAAVSIITKEALYRSTAEVGKRQNSQVLIANAWHHRTDAVSSVVALLAIVGSMCGAPALDPIAGLMVAGMVALTGVQVCTDAMSQLTDAADYDVRRTVAGLAREVPGVVSFDRVRARRMGPQTLVDLMIQTDDMISASAAQQVGQRVRWKILEEMPFVADVMVNVAVEAKPCPAMSSLRPQEDIEQDIRNMVNQKLPEIVGVPKIMVHYINMVTTAEVFIRLDPNLKIIEAADIARRTKRMLSAGIHDLCSAEVHLDLVESYY